MEMKSEINITPLVDIVLVLLIIFMVITPLLNQGYDVSTAKKSTNNPGVGRFVLVEQNGSEYVNVNHNVVPITELKDRLVELLPNNDNAVVYAGADDLVYGTVAQTLDTIRDSGAGRIAITTKIEN
jgi:biopolymer transport protein TolR